MAQWLTFTRADAPKFSKLLNWLFDLPARGTHHGGGVHVTTPDTGLPRRADFGRQAYRERTVTEPGGGETEQVIESDDVEPEA